MKVLVTAFGPFAQNSVNPTQEFASLCSSDEELAFCSFEVLEVSYQAAADFTRQLKIRDWDFVISFGLSSRSQAIYLEEYAYNLDDCSVPDVLGETRQSTPIETNAPEKLRTNLQNLPKRDWLQISQDPGRYLCNHLYYRLLHKARKTRTRCCFFHVPQTNKSGGEMEAELLYKRMKSLIVGVCESGASSRL